MAWIHDAATYGTSDNRNVSVFVRGMLINGDERDLLPPWAGFVGAVIESDVLKPTASRESLQENHDYEAAQHAIRESLIHELARVAKDQPAAWRRILRRHNEALLGAALSDHRLFELLADELTVPTSQGDLRVSTVLERSQGKIHVSQAERGGFEELLFRALKVPVVQGVRYGALPFCREYTEQRRGRLVLIGTNSGNEELFQKLDPTDLSEDVRHRLTAWFGNEQTEVIAARFEPDYLPFVVVPDREVELKRRIESDDADKRIAAAVLGLARGFTHVIEDGAELRLYVNLRCPPVARILEYPDPEDPGVKRVVRLLRPVSSILSETDDRGRIMPIDEALRGFCETLTELLEP
jgi:molecular chaperone HtpG